MESLTTPQLLVLQMIQNCPHIEKSELIMKLTLSERTITYALQRLKKKKLVRRIPKLGDMRKVTYIVS